MHGKHAGKIEWWINARAKVLAGWGSMPRHAHGGRHASDATRKGRAILARVYSVGTLDIAATT